MQKNVHMVPDDGFLHFYTLPFLFQLLAISYLKKKKKTNQQQQLKKTNKLIKLSVLGLCPCLFLI